MIEDGLALLQHSQDPQAGKAGDQMFEGVTADEMAERTDLAVRQFADLGEHVEASHDEEVRSPRIAQWQQQHREESEHGVQLHCAEKTQIVGTMLCG